MSVGNVGGVGPIANNPSNALVPKKAESEAEKWLREHGEELKASGDFSEEDITELAELSRRASGGALVVRPHSPEDLAKNALALRMDVPTYTEVARLTTKINEHTGGISVREVQIAELASEITLLPGGDGKPDLTEFTEGLYNGYERSRFHKKYDFSSFAEMLQIAVKELKIEKSQRDMKSEVSLEEALDYLEGSTSIVESLERSDKILPQLFRSFRELYKAGSDDGKHKILNLAIRNIKKSSGFIKENGKLSTREVMGMLLVYVYSSKSDQLLNLKDAVEVINENPAGFLEDAKSVMKHFEIKEVKKKTK